MGSICRCIATHSLTILLALVGPAAAANSPEEQAVFDALKTHAETWTKLPMRARDMKVLQNGRPVLYSFGTRNEAQLKESVERLASGTSIIVDGGDIVLVDRQDRWWVRPVQGPELYCLDHGKWTTPASASAPEQKDAFHGIDRGEFFAEAWQDAKGNCWFLSKDDDLRITMHGLAPDGKWSSQMLVDDPNNQLMTGFELNAMLVEQAGGLMSLCPQDYGSSGLHPGIVCYDGSKWSLMKLAGCHVADHTVLNAAPLLDGSVLVECEGRRLWVFWPPAARKLAEARVPGLIKQLSDPTQAKREAAYEQLVRMGTIATSQMQAARSNASTAGAALIARAVSDVQEERADAGNDEHSESRRFAGRYRYSLGVIGGRDSKGRALIYLEGFTDAQERAVPVRTTPAPRNAGPPLSQALAYVQPDGTWDVHRFTEQQWRGTGIDGWPMHAYFDASGQVWVDGKCITDTTGNVRDDIPATSAKSWQIDESKDGRFFSYWDDAAYFIDPPKPAIAATQPSKPGDLTQKQYALGRIRAEQRGHALYAHTLGESQHAEVYRLGSTPELLTAKWPPMYIADVNPLRDGNVLVGTCMSDPNTLPPFYAALGDGKTWKYARTTKEMVSAQAKTLAKLTYTNWPGIDSSTKLAGDGKGHLWFAEEVTEDPPDTAALGVDSYPCNRFRYYDGTRWHDVWAEWNVSEGKPAGKPANDPKHNAPDEGYPADRQVLATLNQGASILVVKAAATPWIVSYVQGKLNVKPLKFAADLPDALSHSSNPTSNLFGWGFMDTSSGESWFTHINAERLAYIRDGTLYDGGDGNIQLIDSADRIWVNSAGGKNLRARVRGKWIDVELGKSDECEGLVEGPDKRLWLLTEQALIQLDVDQNGIVKPVGRWPWPTGHRPAGSCMADNSGGLWFAIDNQREVRVSLPLAAASSTRPVKAPTSRPVMSH